MTNMTPLRMIDDSQYLWTEKYRPQTIQVCILPDVLKKTFQEYVNQKQVPNLLLAGTPGSGKTTAAMALCEELDIDYMMINASVERGVETIKTKVHNYASSMSFKHGRKCIIFDEADSLTPDAQLAVRGAIEEFASNCAFIFTCNFKARIIEAIHSRCAVIEFKIKGPDKVKMAVAFMSRLEAILSMENVKYDKKVLAEIIQKHFPDYRRVLNECQRYATHGPIDVGILSYVSDIGLSELVKYLKEKDWKSMRKWVGLNSDADQTVIYRKIFDGLYENMKPDCIPQAVLILADYQYKAAFVADGEINLCAALTELMGGCSWK